MHGTTALILAGGLGTRLRDALPALPKVLAPVGGRPFVTYLLDVLAKAGQSRVVLCTGYRADEVERALGARYAGLDLVYSHEESALDTAGAVRRALPLLETQTALVANGDSLCEADFEAMWSSHRARRASATILLTGRSERGAFGSVDIGAEDRVIRFEEKVEGDARFINAGVYLLERDVLEGITPERRVSFERDVFPPMVAAGTLFGFPAGGRFIDIGTPRTYGESVAFFAALR